MFFTTNGDDGLFILQKLYEKAEELTIKGYGHGEESIYAFVILEKAGIYLAILHTLNILKIAKK
jgi:hypothetical protein